MPNLRILVFAGTLLAAYSASLPAADDGVLVFNGNGKNGWESALDQMARGGGGGAMMWSGWGPAGMTAFTSTGPLGGDQGGLEPPAIPEERTPRAGPQDHPGYQASNGHGSDGQIGHGTNGQNGHGSNGLNGHGNNGHRSNGQNGHGTNGQNGHGGNGQNGHGTNANGLGARTDDNGSRSSAAASFNAWFPIVLGMMPGGGRSGGRDEGWPPVAAIANSVSHGERGVATSHAVAYGSQPSRSYPSSYPAQDQPATAPLSSRYYGGRQP